MSSLTRKQLWTLSNRSLLHYTTLNSYFTREASLTYAHHKCSVRLIAQQHRQQQFRLNHAKIREVRTMAEMNSTATKDENHEIMAVWPDVVRDLTEANPEVPEVNKWLAKVLQYNVPRGKKTRALAVIDSYKLLAPSDQLTEENLRLARILGWCVEMLQAFLLVIDDIQDKSVTRRGMPCWYLQNEIGLAAINDGLMLNTAIYQLLQKYFKDRNCYVELVEEFQNVTFKAITGQCLDLLSTNLGKKPDLNLFTMDRYTCIANYKTGQYTCVLPVAIAMLLANIRDPEIHRQARPILIEMGEFFQVQDDFLDIYGDEQVTGKKGTDIQEGKCSWMIVVALQRATPRQRQIFEECYGCKEPEKVAQVKQLYNELDLPNVYSTYEKKMYNLLNTQIQQMPHGIPHEVFLNILEKLYRRQK